MTNDDRKRLESGDYAVAHDPEDPARPVPVMRAEASDAEHAVTAERVTRLEEVEVHRAEQIQHRRNKRISAALSYLMLGIATGVIILWVVTQQNRLEQLSRDNQTAIVRIERESAERRDQNCTILEGQHLESITQLERTYDYLAGLSDEDARSSINQAVLVGLANTEREAKIDQAPPYCDEPGEKAEKEYEDSGGRSGAPPVGLPEPDPKIPERPERVDELYQRAVESARS